MFWQNCLKRSESNCFPLSTIRTFGTPNLQTMFYQKNFLTIAEVMLASGLASIHLVKYLIATTTYLLPLRTVVRAKLGPFPIFAKAKLELSAMWVPKGWIDVGMSFGKLRRF